MSLCVLINSFDQRMSAQVQAQLRTGGIRTVLTQPGASFIDVARRERPQVAVLDLVDERMDAAQMEIQLLKELNQDVRIIAVSRRPSQQDASVVEQGVFFYMTMPASGELVRVVQAAARASEPAAKSKSRVTPILLVTLMLIGMGGSVRAAAPTNGKPVLKPDTKTDDCANAGCHANLMSSKFMHGPAAQQKCMACHEYDEPREHRFKFASDQNKLCGDCHAMKHRTTVHTPVQQGRCTGCHDPHGSEHRSMLKGDPTRGLCLSCHKGDFSEKKFVHGPVNTGACILCHEPHSAWQPKLLVDTPDKLCKSCHSELTPKGDLARHVHAPVETGNCTACHDAHASNERFQLHTSSAELCTSCHKETAKMLSASHVVHGALAEEGGCSSCHSPHFSHLPKLQKTAQPESCLKCHDKPLKTKDGSTLTDMVALLKENPQQHGPIREGACTACHQPHAGDNFRLLTAEYPPEFYAPFKLDNYALCFKCHIPDLVLKEKGAGLTRFRNGETNLHWLHVNREKGRTCRACHEVHASKNPFHIRDAVPFGSKGWMLEIKYQQSAKGGSCSPGCHNEKSYDRGDAVAPPQTSVRSEGIDEPRPSQTSLAQ